MKAKRKRGGQPKPKAVLRRNTVTVRIRDDVWERLNVVANADGRALSAQAALLLEDALRGRRAT